MGPGLYWARDQATWPNSAWSRFVQAGGIRWHVQRAGTGPVILFVHGTGASTHSWRKLLPLVARGFTVIAADLPGHGFTAPAGGADCSLDGMSRLHASLIQALDIEPEHCVGHSAGAAIVCRMALDGHVAPRSIVSVNGAFLPLGGSAGVLFAPLAKLFSKTPLLPRLIAWHAADSAAVARVIASTGSDLDAEGLALYGRLVRDPAHIAGALRMMSHWNLGGFDAQLRRLAPRLTLIAAANDRTVPPEQAQHVKGCAADARIVQLPGLGHLAHEEAPEIFADLLTGLFEVA
jgi:magnesium chelatase accessory protein